MKTAQRVKALIRPLLERHVDLVAVGPASLCLVPVNHVARVITIHRPRAASYFSIEWRLFEQFIPRLSWVRTYGWSDGIVGRSQQFRTSDFGGGIWKFSDPTMNEDFLFQMEAIILPQLRSLGSLTAFATFARQHRLARLCASHYWTMAVEAALGNVDSAPAAWEPIADRHPGAWAKLGQDAGPDRFGQIGAALMAKDRIDLAEILRAVEAENVAGGHFAPYWQAVPFPLET